MENSQNGSTTCSDPLHFQVEHAGDNEPPWRIEMSPCTCGHIILRMWLQAERGRLFRSAYDLIIELELQVLVEGVQ